MDTMSTFYRVGFHPWEDAEGHPPFVETITRLFEDEERGVEPPYGSALDVGTGSGIWATTWRSAAGKSPASTSWAGRRGPRGAGYRMQRSTSVSSTAT